MAWYYVPDLKGAASPQDYLDKALSGDRPSIRQRVLKSSVVSDVYYAAIEQIDTGNGHRKVLAFIAELDMSGCLKYPFGYLDSDENKCPAHYDCPADILGLLTRPESSGAANWRRQCQRSPVSVPADFASQTVRQPHEALH